VSPATHILQRSRVASEQKNDLNVPWDILYRAYLLTSFT
jgi:hypothetical protein